MLAAIALGAFLSWWLSPRFAVASAAAFALSELADFTVYEPLRRRGWLRAVTASNLVGLAVDSALFLWLAFGSLDDLAGLIVGKLYMTAAAIVLLWGVRRALPVWFARARLAPVARLDAHAPHGPGAA